MKGRFFNLFPGIRTLSDEEALDMLSKITFVETQQDPRTRALILSLHEKVID